MTGRADAFQQLMNQGHSAAWDQSWDQAAEFYQQALLVNPHDPSALNNLGLAFLELQRYPEALQAYSQAAILAPENPISFLKIGQISESLGRMGHAVKAYQRAAELYLKNQQIEKAIENLSQVTWIDVENQAAHSRLALIYERQGHHPQACAEYLIIAGLFQRRGEIEKAIQAANYAIKISPQSREPHQALAALREGRPLPAPLPVRPGKVPVVAAPESTLSSLELPAPADPLREARDRSLADLAGLLFDDPFSEVEASSDGSSPPSGAGSPRRQRSRGDQISLLLRLQQAVDLQTRGQDLEAAEALQAVVEAGLDHPAIWFNLGWLQFHADQFESAGDSFRRSLAQAEYALPARLLSGQALQRLNQEAGAALEFLEALRLADLLTVREDQAGNLQRYYDQLADWLQRRADAPTWVRLSQNVMELLVRSDWRAYLQKARQSLLAGSQEEQPLPFGEILVAARSSRMIESLGAMHQLAQAGQLRSAMEEALNALLYAPAYLPVHITIADLFLQQGRLPEAIEKYKIVSQTYSTRGDVQPAIDLLRRVIRLAPLEVGARRQLIDLLIAAGQGHEAVQAWMELAGVYYDLADLDLARDAFREAMDLANRFNLDIPLKVKILHQLADLEVQSLDWRSSLQVYEQIRTLQPDDPRARITLVSLNLRLGQDSHAMGELKNYLSYLAEQGSVAQAVSFVEGLLSDYPDHVGLRRQLAGVFRPTGRAAPAVAEMERGGEGQL